MLIHLPGLPYIGICPLLIAAEPESYTFIFGKSCDMNIDKENSDNRFENAITFRISRAAGPLNLAYNLSFFLKISTIGPKPTYRPHKDSYSTADLISFWFSTSGLRVTGLLKNINDATEAPGDDIHIGFPSKRRICQDDYSQSFFRDIRHGRGENHWYSRCWIYRMDVLELIGIQIPSGEYMFLLS